MKNKSTIILFGTVVLILLAVALVAILGRGTPSNSSTDVRARAGIQNALKFVGVVASVDEAKGTILVTNVQLADEDRAGKAQNMGEWTVTVPAAFNFASASPGTTVTIGVEATTVNIVSHTFTAVTLTPGK
jgi:hypothetical protein